MNDFCCYFLSHEAGTVREIASTSFTDRIIHMRIRAQFSRILGSVGKIFYVIGYQSALDFGLDAATVVIKNHSFFEPVSAIYFSQSKFIVISAQLIETYQKPTWASEHFLKTKDVGNVRIDIAIVFL